jgi:hypothetical protein
MDGWNDSLVGDYLWSNVNFGEAITAVMTPIGGIRCVVFANWRLYRPNSNSGSRWQRFLRCCLVQPF